MIISGLAEKNGIKQEGGKPINAKTTSTLIYDATTDTYTEGPSTLFARTGFACTVFYSEFHQAPVVVAAGGSGYAGNAIDGARAGNEAELWAYGKENSGWEKSKCISLHSSNLYKS